MDGTTEKDCSPLWSLFQQIVSDMKNHAPMWEEFITKATKLHSALKSALVAIAAFLDAFQKIADGATNARGATKEIGTALTRVCLRHRAIETRMKTFISTLMDTLITPLSEKAEEWRRGACATGGLSREHARECKRARAELRRRVHDAQRHARKARRAPPDAKRRADVCMQDIQERKQQLEEMEEKAVKAALVEERSRFCHFVSLLNPVVECEVAMLAEVGHLQEGSEQLIRHTAEPRTLPAASLQVICDIKSCHSVWAEEAASPPASRLGSRKSSLTSLCSVNSQCSDHHHGSTLSCSTPVSNASSSGTIPAPSNDLSQTARLSSVCSADSGFRSQDALQRRSLYADHGSDNQSVSSECMISTKPDGDDEHDNCGNAASATWPDLKDTAQFERAATAIMGGRPHTISAAYSGGHPRAALSVHTFTSEAEGAQTPREGIYSRPPLPTRCSSLERPVVPAKSAANANTGQHEFKPTKPSSLPPHLTKGNNANTGQHEFKPTKPSSLPPHLTKGINANTGQHEFKPTKPSSLPPHLTRGNNANTGQHEIKPTKPSSLPPHLTKGINANTGQHEFKPTKPSSLPPHLTRGNNANTGQHEIKPTKPSSLPPHLTKGINANTGQHEFKPTKPSSLPPHLTKGINANTGQHEFKPTKPSSLPPHLTRGNNANTGQHEIKPTKPSSLPPHLTKGINANTGQHEFKPTKPSSLPPHLTKGINANTGQHEFKPTKPSSLPPHLTKGINANTGQHEFKPTKPSSLPPYLTKEMPAAVYVNMSELASLAASRAQQQHHDPPQEKVCSESSASESSLESSSGYGSQGAFAAEDHTHIQQLQHPDVESEIVTLRRDSDASVAAARENFSISLGSLEEAVRSLDETCETPTFATIGKKPAVPKRRPVSMTATVWSRRGSSSSLGKPPPPVRRSSSISRPQRPPGMQGPQSPQVPTNDADNLPPPPAFLLQPDNEANNAQQTSVAEAVKQLTELKHTPASPAVVRRAQQIQQSQLQQSQLHQSQLHQSQLQQSQYSQQSHQSHQSNANSPTTPSLSTFQQAKSNFSSSTSLNSTGNLNPIYGQTGHRIMAYVENSIYVRKNSLNNSNSDLFREATTGQYDKGSPLGSTPSTPSYGDNNSFSSFGPRVSNEASHYGQTGYKLQQEKKYGQSNTIYAQPSQIIAGFNNLSIRHDTLSPLALRKNIAARSHSADRHNAEQGGLIAALSAKLAPQLSPRTARRAMSSITAADTPTKGKGVVPGAVQPAFLDKLSATIQQQRRQLDSPRASSVRDIINAHAQPDPRVCHTSLMEQIKRGATLRRNKHCNDRSAPKIR